MADKRAFFKVDCGYLMNPKVAAVAAESPTAVLLHLAAIGYSAQHLTDGVVPLALVTRIAGASQGDVDLLLNRSLLLDLGDGDVEVHDYLEHQRSSSDAKSAESKAKRAARARWDAEQGASSNASSNASSMPNPMPREREREKREETPSEVADATIRPDVEKILDHLDDRIRANGFKIPNRTKANTTAARLLLDRDGYTLDQILWLIDWATSDEFWRSNIRSASKLREKFDTLKDRAKTQATGKGRNGPPVAPKRDQWLDR